MEGREGEGSREGRSAWGPLECGADRVKRSTQVSSWGHELMVTPQPAVRTEVAWQVSENVYEELSDAGGCSCPPCVQHCFPCVCPWEIVMGRGDPGWPESCDSLIATGRLPPGQDSDRRFLAQSCYRPNSIDFVFQAQLSKTVLYTWMQKALFFLLK